MTRIRFALTFIAILAFATPVAAQQRPPQERQGQNVVPQETETFCGIVDYTLWEEKNGETVFTVFWQKGGGFFSKKVKDPRPPYTFVGEPQFPPLDGGMYDFTQEKKRDSKNRRVFVLISTATSCGGVYAK